MINTGMRWSVQEDGTIKDRYVWIDDDGTVKALTEAEHIEEEKKEAEANA